MYHSSGYGYGYGSAYGPSFSGGLPSIRPTSGGTSGTLDEALGDLIERGAEGLADVIGLPDDDEGQQNVAPQPPEDEGSDDSGDSGGNGRLAIYGLGGAVGLLFVIEIVTSFYG